MKKKKSYAIVTTTINIPLLLDDYLCDAKRYNRIIEQVIVVGDRKTPIETASYCKKLQDFYKYPIKYVSVADQEQFLSKWPKFEKYLPWNCIQRRNVGLLMAYFQGNADIVVTLDDDNFIAQPDYFGGHEHLGEEVELEVISSQSGWWNVCDVLTEKNNQRFYHRGYPLSKRWSDDEKFMTKTNLVGRAVVNAGLWLDDPDVDALSRLFAPIQAINYKLNEFQKTFALSVNTWSPFNSQNTALLREVIPAYLLFPNLGRYDDIWASYIVRHISDCRGEFVTYGYPLVRQKRNAHNYFKDFDDERFGLQNNEIFLEALKKCIFPAGTTYQVAFQEISLQLPSNIKNLLGMDDLEGTGFSTVEKGLILWSEIFK